MKLTKSETTLLGILAALVLIVGSYYLLLAPLQTSIDSKKAQYAQLELQQINMQALLQNPNMQGLYEAQRDVATDHYDSFYSTLNAYTIDNILSGLMDDYAIDVLKLKISPYEPADWQTIGDELPEDTAPEQTAEGEEENILLKSTVEIQAGGTYNSTMSFIDAMNAKSFCLQVRDMQIAYRTEQNLIETEVQFSCFVDIYGIEVPEGLPAPV